MNRRVVKKPQAYRDVVDQADYIARDSLQAAIRFAEAFEATCQFLRVTPGLGSPWETDSENYADLGYLLIQDFPNHLVFFRETRGGIEILRVCHAARDLDNLL